MYFIIKYEYVTKSKFCNKRKFNRLRKNLLTLFQKIILIQNKKDALPCKKQLHGNYANKPNY